MTAINFTTGASQLPDVGELSYNGCRFSPLFTSTLSAIAQKDAAGRTVKYLEVTLTVDGYVTLGSAQDDQVALSPGTSISSTMTTLAARLMAQGGTLVYRGRGFDLVINAAGGLVVGGPGAQSITGSDVAWGPVPELIEFQPLGGGLSAKIQWRVKVHIINTTGRGALLQFNTDTVVTYGEDGYSSLSIRGAMEIPLTRRGVNDHTVATTVDAQRDRLDVYIFRTIDLSRFRVVRRDYTISRDKRLMEFDIALEEKPYMDLPPGCTVAHGSYSVRPAKQGAGLASWLCTLRATYTIRNDLSKNNAWYAFLALLRLRMKQAQFGIIVLNNQQQQQQQQQQQPGILAQIGDAIIDFWVGGLSQTTPSLLVFTYWEWYLKEQERLQKIANDNRPFLIDFSYDEGLYLDSKTISFSATWRLITQFGAILLASGQWKKVPEKDALNNNVWAMSMRDVQGSESWLPNKLDPNLDIIVDFGV